MLREMKREELDELRYVCLFLFRKCHKRVWATERHIVYKAVYLKGAEGKEEVKCKGSLSFSGLALVLVRFGVSGTFPATMDMISFFLSHI